MMAVERDDSFDFLPQQQLQLQKQRLQSQIRLPQMPPREEFPFLRADHSFEASTLADPGSARDPASICLSFTSGDIVYVHFVHTSGWGDVTLVRTAERGWIPVDYFSGYTDERAIPLLAAIASFVARPRSQRLLGTNGDDGLTFSEAAINEIISGTKLLLAKTNTISRDSRLVSLSDAVRASRKALLTELVHIVYVAKNNKHSTNPDIINKLVRGCFRTLSSAADFINTIDQPELQALVAQESPERRSASSHSSQKSGKSAHSAHSSISQSAHSDLSRRSSQSQPSQNSSSDWDDAHPLYRMRSFSDHVEIPAPINRLHEVTGAFTGYLRAFLDPSNLLSDSDAPETSPAILTVTRHCMLACRELLTVLDVAAPSSRDDEVLENNKDALLTEIRKLVSAARSVVAALPPAPASLRAVATQNLVVVAARCSDLGLRCARRCAAIFADLPLASLPPDRSYPIFEGGELVDLRTESKQTDTSEGALPPASVPTSAPALVSQKAAETSETGLDTDRPRFNSAGSTESSFSASSVSSIAIDPLEPVPEHLSQEEVHSQLHTDLVQTSSQRTMAEPLPDVGLIYRNGEVRGGSLAALVQWLAGPEQPEFELRVFLLCFRLFASPRDVVVELGACTPSEQVQRFATLWIESFWADDNGILNALALIAPAALVKARRQLSVTGPKYSQLLPRTLAVNTTTSLNSSTTSIASANSSRRPSLGQSIGTARQQLAGSSALNLAASFREFGLGSRRSSRRTSQDETGVRRIASGSSVHIPSVVDEPGDGVDLLLARTPLEIAQQFTAMWFDIFATMRPSELLDQRFSSAKRSLGLAPNVNQLVLCSNHLTAFVGDTILSTDLTSRQRAKVVKHWLRVADEMFTLGNLNGVVTVILTLQSTRISRLRKAWDSVGPKSQAILAKLSPFTSPERNFSEYRKELRRRAGQPCVPYIGILLGDLTLIDEGNPRLLKLESGDQAINFDRYIKTARAIGTVQQYQNIPFQITPDSGLQSWLRGRSAKSHSMDSRHSDDQWRRSVLIQPE